MTSVAIQQKNNESCAWSLPVALPNETWPIDDIAWHLQGRDVKGVLALDYSMARGNITVGNIDPDAKTIVLSFETLDDISQLLGNYFGELKLIRGARKNDLADVTWTFVKGNTVEA